MSYTDKIKEKETRKKWVQNNRESRNRTQRKYNLKRFIEKYSFFIQTIQSCDIKEKAKILRPVQGLTRKKIYKYFIIPFTDQIEKEIKRIKWRDKEKSYKERIKTYKKKRAKIKFIEKYSFFIQTLQSYNFKEKAKNLSGIYYNTRKKIYKYFIIPFTDQIEKEISVLKRKKSFKRSKLKAKKRIDNNWNFVKNWIINQGCDCGEKNISKLSFHHKNPSQKEDSIRKICKRNTKKIIEELKKGVVKCKNCHTIIHIGTSREREEILINQYFNKKSNRRWRYKNKLAIWEFKKTLSCIKCGIKDPVILLFHHIDSSLKNEKISIIYRKSHNIINQEIAKTVCLCHNCHQDFHYIYGLLTTQIQLEEYLNKKAIPLKVDIKDYFSIIDQKTSEFYKLSFLIA